MKPFISLLYLLMVFSSVVFSQQRPPGHRLTGVIRDQDSAVIPGLLLEIGREGEKKGLITDVNGEFEVVLAAGNWELSATRLKKENFRVFLKIRDNALNPASVELTIDSTLLCCKNSNGKRYPQITRFPFPAYPPRALAVRAGGQVVVKVTIGKDGTVGDAVVESGLEVFNDQAIGAARSCVFEASESEEIREARITYYFIPTSEADGKKPVKRYKDRYTAHVTTLLSV